MKDLKIEYIPVSELKEYENNTRKHGRKDVEAIMQSIREFGFNDAVGIWKDNIIIEGHGRVKAAKRLGIEKVPCVRLDHLTDEQRKAYGIAHNKTAENSSWDKEALRVELEDIEIDMTGFGFSVEELKIEPKQEEFEEVDTRDPSCQHNVFENQELMQFPCEGKYGIPVMDATHTTGDQMLRFADWKEIDNPEDYIAHFYYDDYKFIAAWREPDKYIERLRRFKAVVSPDFSLYTDFPRALQILSCYRRQWCGAYWQALGLDVIPDVVWGDKESYEFCFDGIPKGGTVAVSSVGVKNDEEWNNKKGQLFIDGYNEMLKRLKPETILFYGKLIDGLEGNIIRIPSYYEEKAKRMGNGKRHK